MTWELFFSLIPWVLILVGVAFAAFYKTAGKGGAFFLGAMFVLGGAWLLYINVQRQYQSQAVNYIYPEETYKVEAVAEVEGETYLVLSEKTDKGTNVFFYKPDSTIDIPDELFEGASIRYVYEERRYLEVTPPTITPEHYEILEE